MIDLSPFHTGDIILFGGNTIDLPEQFKSFGDFIESFTVEVGWKIIIIVFSYWYHIGMIVERQHIPQQIPIQSEDDKFIWEARLATNVILSPLTARVNGGAQIIAVRQIIPGLGPVQIQKIQENLIAFQNAKFEKNIWEFINAYIDVSFIPENEPDLSTVFCAEMIAETFKRAGLLTTNKPSSEFIPDDFAELTQARSKDGFWTYNTPITLSGSFSLSKEIVIKPVSNFSCAYHST